MADLNVSIVKPLGYQRSTSCGYCKKSEGNSSYYISCEKLRVEHYQELVNKGWRRSGTTYYKPDLTRSCCPHYTIRLDSSSFKPSRDQRKALHRLNSYVLGPDYTRKAARLCPVSRKEKREKRDKFDLLSSVHAAELPNVKTPVDPSTKKSIEPAHKFEVTLEAADFSTEKYDLFLKYQMTVHKELKSRWSHQSHKRWLCGGLERRTSPQEGGKTQKLGTYHQCYRLDGKLIAVGVLDLMPQCVSSVYLFYDPDYEHWQLGKLSATREIALAVEGQYRYYYMGYYIHSCVKMRYKGAYAPSYLLDPESLEWNSFDNEYRKQLDRSLYYAPSSAKIIGTEKESFSNGNRPGSKQDDEQNKSTATKASSEAPDSFDLVSESSEDGTEIPEGSLFDYKIPGVLKLEEVEKLDLDHWKLLFRNRLVDFENLKGWEKSSMTDPQSLKGIAAELAAALGSMVVKESAVVLF